MKLKPLLTLLLCVALQGDCAKILGIFHFPSKSHHILGSALLKALAARGHQVTMISPFPLKIPWKNYEDIELTGMTEYQEGKMQKIMEMPNASVLEKLFIATKHISIVNEMLLNHTVIKDLKTSKRKFDLVIQVWAGNEALLGLAHYLEASTILFSTSGANFMTNSITGNPAPYSYVPNIVLALAEEMTYLQRVANSVSYTLCEIFQKLSNIPAQEISRQKYFPKAPPVQELLQNISLVLLNSHYSIESPRPHVPSMIQISGFHLEEPKELTGELRKFMDSAAEGVLFFSLGSNFKSSDLSSYKLEAIIQAFSKLSVKVLWKFEKDNLPNLPQNVKIGKWLPQRDILAHRNLKVFVTHGGLLSTTEAVYHGIPMVGIPIFGDQEANVAEAVNKGYAIGVGFNDFTEETLTNAINEVLNNPKYRENIQQRSKVFRDQPIKPMDNAIFWVEYVLRHKGAHHLKTSALKLEWYQYYLLDVIALLLGILLAVTIATFFIICKVVKLCKKVFKKKQKPPGNISKGKKKSKVA